MANFTKGEWNYDESTGLVECGDEIICDLMPDGDSFCDANGHLIKCAPEMHKLLKYTRDWFHLKGCNERRDEIDALLKKVEAN